MVGVRPRKRLRFGFKVLSTTNRLVFIRQVATNGLKYIEAGCILVVEFVQTRLCRIINYGITLMISAGRNIAPYYYF